MGKVALDVATLRSASRLLFPEGQRADDGAYVDLDVAALGQLIEAIILFDEVIVPDLGHQLDVPAIAERFGVVVSAHPVEPDVAGAVMDASRKWIGRNPDLDLTSLIHLVGGKPEFSTQIGGSDSWSLLLGSMGVDKAHAAIATDWIREIHGIEMPNAIRSGFLMGRWSKHSKKGEWRWEQYEVPDALWDACANLAWLTFRARCYDLVCQRIAVPYMPHPLRTSVAGYTTFTDDAPAAAGKRDRPWTSTRRPLVYSYVDAMKIVYRELEATVSEALGGAFVPVQAPVLLPHVLGKAGDREQVMAAAYEIRDSRGARRLRAHVDQVEQSIAAGDLRAALRLVQELNRLTAALRRELGLRSPDTPGMTVSIAGVASVQLSPDQVVRLTGPLTRRLTVTRPRLMFLRNVFNDLATAASLGHLYELLT